MIPAGPGNDVEWGGVSCRLINISLASGYAWSFIITLPRPVMDIKD